jgi:N-acyl-D-amino-acid deacylase
MEAGAYGVSTGLDYVPGIYAQLDELVELCRIVAAYGSVYASHLRGYTGTLVSAVEEAIEIGERSGVAIQLSHMNVLGRANWGATTRIVELVNAARERGVDVTADMMSYPTGGA